MFLLKSLHLENIHARTPVITQNGMQSRLPSIVQGTTDD